MKACNVRLCESYAFKVIGKAADRMANPTQAHDKTAGQRMLLASGMSRDKPHMTV